MVEVVGDIPEPVPHSACRGKLQAAADNFGVDVVISTAPPLVDGPYRAEGLTCPHGTTYYTQPTGEQIAQWARDGVR